MRTSGIIKPGQGEHFQIIGAGTQALRGAHFQRDQGLRFACDVRWPAPRCRPAALARSQMQESGASIQRDHGMYTRTDHHIVPHRWRYGMRHHFVGVDRVDAQGIRNVRSFMVCIMWSMILPVR
jgi:hypothetical protein